MAESTKLLLSWKVIQALPGYYLWYVDQIDAVLFGPEPIIGWIIEQRAAIDGQYFWAHQPMTAAQANIDQAIAIEWPNGKFDFPEETTVNSLEEANRWLQREKRRTEEAINTIANLPLKDRSDELQGSGEGL